jgi:hypothetical protein
MPPSLLGRKWTWQSRLNATLVLLICAGVVSLLGLVIVSNFRAAADAVHSLDRARTLTSMRITKLNAEIAALSRQNARAQRQRGLLLAEVHDLTQQLKALGVEPVASTPSFGQPQPQPTSTVVEHRTTSPSPHPTVTRTRTAEPQPSHSSTPTPHPSETCLNPPNPLPKVCR